MSVFLYRYLRKKYKERHAGSQGDSPSLAQDVQQQQQPVAPIAPSSNDRQPAAPSVDSPTLMWRIMIMGALAIPVFLETLDYTIVATAQVHIASDFNRLDLQSYIGTVYLLTSAVFLPPFASIADIFGRHWALQLAIAFFVIGSAVSTGAQNMPMMLAGRGLSGIGAAGLLAVVRIILTDSRSLNDNNWQQILLFLLYTIGFCVGPFIGGELLNVSFRWIFAINLPCCAVAAVLAFLLLRGRTKNGQPSKRLPTAEGERETFLDKLARIDWVGAALFMAGGILLLLALNWGSVGDWDSAKVIACFVVGGIAIIAFLLWEYYLERIESVDATSRMRLLYTDPMIPLGLFKSVDTCAIMYGTLVSGMVMLVMFYFVAIFFVVVSNLSASKSGAQLIYFAPGMGAGSLISIQMIRLIRQPRYPAILGGLVVTVALGLISMGMDQQKQNLVNGFMALAGVGTGLSIGPLAIQARFTQPAERNAVVSALLLFFRAIGGTIGLAQCGAVLNAKVKSYITDLARQGLITAAEAQAISISSSAGLTSVGDLSDFPPNIQQIVRDAFAQGSRYAFISLIPWAGLAFLTSLLLSKIKDTDASTPGQTPLIGESDASEKDKEGSPKVQLTEYTP